MLLFLISFLILFANHFSISIKGEEHHEAIRLLCSYKTLSINPNSTYYWLIELNNGTKFELKTYLNALNLTETKDYNNEESKLRVLEMPRVVMNTKNEYLKIIFSQIDKKNNLTTKCDCKTICKYKLDKGIIFTWHNMALKTLRLFSKLV